MSKINRIFNTITIGIILISVIGISGTFISDYLISINWFGDYEELRYKGKEYEYLAKCWGVRHYWYNWSLSLLVLTSVLRLFINVITIVDETIEL